MNSTNPIIFQPLTIDHAARESVPAAVFPFGDVSTRKEMRKYVNKATTVANELQNIVNDFSNTILNAPEHISYLTIFDHFAEQWYNVCQRYNTRRHKLKNVAIDSHWFVNHFQPKVFP